jgi:hypothetical protein
MYQLIPATQKLVPIVKEHGPILLPVKGKMIPHKYCQKSNKLVATDETIRR